MASNGGRVQIGIDYKLNKAGLNELKQTLQEVQRQLTAMGNEKKGPRTEIEATVKAAKELESILNDAWNSKLNQLDLNKVNTGIKSTFGSVQRLKSEMEKGGATGSAAYNKVASAILNTNLQLKQSNKLLDDMADTMAKTVKWGITSSIFNRISGSIQEAWGYTKKLDNSLNDIRIVTEKSAESMQQFAREANAAAKSLGASTTEYTDASLIYFQQGLSDEEVAARAQTTIKAANVTGQSADEVSEQLTAVWNGYKVSAQEAELYVDKLAAVAASTAADLEELSTGMSKVASAANSMGVDVDQLNAQLATIVSVTRQAPESVGTALKTIYARLGDLAIDGQDEFGVALGTVSGQMQDLGIAILDEQGNMREMGEVIEETAAKWGTWTEAQRQAAAVAMAGKRQYNNLIALFENWDMYTEALNTSVDATGTLQKQQDIYMESMEAHLQKMATEAEKTYDVLFNEEVIKEATDAVTKMLSIFNDFIEGIGGGGKALMYFGSLATRVFNKQITEAVLTAKRNIEVNLANAAGEKIKDELIDADVARNNALKATDVNENSAAYEAQLKAAKEIFNVRRGLTQEQYQESMNLNAQIGKEAQKLSLLKQENERIKDRTKEYKILKIDESTSLDYIKSKTQARDEDVKIIGKGIVALEKIKFLNRDVSEEKERQIDVEKELNLLKEQYKNITAQIGWDEDATEKEWNDIVEKIKEGNLNLEEFNNLIMKAKGLQKQYAEEAKAGQSLIEKINKEDLPEQIKLQETELELLRKKNKEIAHSGEESLKYQKIIKNISSISQGLVAILGTLPTIMDESASTADKWRSGFATISSLASSIGSAFGPVGFAIGNVGSAIISTIGTSIVKGIEKQEKKIKEVKQEWQNLANDVSSSNKNINSLNNIASEFEYLSTGVTKYGENISLTATEYERYQDIINDIVQISPEVVEGYTSEGKAIVNNNELIEKSIKLLEDERRLKMQSLLTDEKLDALFEDKKKTYKNAKTELNSKEYDLNTLSTPLLGGRETIIGGLLIRGSENISKVEKDTAEAYKQEFDDVKKLFHYIDELGFENFDLEKFLNNREEIFNRLQTIETEYNLDEIDVFGDYKQFFSGDNEGFQKLVEDFEKADGELEVAQAAHESSLKGLNSTIITWMSTFNEDYSNLSSEQQALIQKYINSFSTEVFDEDTFNAFTDNASKFVTMFKDLDNEIQKQLLELSDPSNYESYAAYLASLKEVIKKGGLSPEDIKNVAAAFDITDIYINEEDQMVVTSDLQKKINDLNNQFKEQLQDSAIDLTEYFSYEAFQNGSFTNLDGLDLSKITNIDDFNEKIEIIRTNTAIEKLYKDFQNIKKSIEEIDAALEEYNKNGEISEELIDSLEKKYTELGKIQNKNSHEYIKALREQKQAEEDAAKATLIDRIEELTKQATFYIEADSSKAEETIKKLMETKYQLKLEIDADLKSDVIDSFGLAKEFEKLREYITEDLKISFDEAQEFIAKGYGEILTNAKETNEGLIQLNDEQAKVFLLNEKRKLEEDANSRIERLNREKTELENQLKILEIQLGAYLNASETEDVIDRETHMKEATRQEASYQAYIELLNDELIKDEIQKSELSETAQNLYDSLTGMYQIDLDNSVTADSLADESTRTYQQNVINYYNAMHNAVRQYADAVRKAASGEKIEAYTAEAVQGTAINTENELTPVANNYSKNDFEEISPEDIFGKLSETYTGLDDDEQKEVARKLAENTEARIKTLKAQIGSIDSAIAALKTSGESFDETFSKIGESSDKNKDIEESLENIYDRYREINIQLALIETNLNRVQKQQEKLSGKAYTENLEQQLELLNQQIDANREKVKIMQTEQAELMSLLETQGARFNDEGQVTNYKEVMDKALANANAAIDAYNTMSEKEQKTYKATMESAKESYQALDDAFKRFDELYSSEIPGLIDEIQEALDEAIDIKIEQFNTDVKIELDLREAKRQWNDFYANIVKDLKNDDLVGKSELAITQLDTYVSKDNNIENAGTIAKNLDKLATLNEQANQILTTGWSSIYGDNVSQLLEDLNSANDQLMSDMADAKSLADSVYDNYLSSIDSVIKGNDAVIKQYEYVGNLLDHNKKLIELLGGSAKSTSLTSYYAERNSLNQQIVEDHAKNAQYYQEMMESVSDKTSEEWQKWHESWQSEVASLNAAIIQGMEDAAAAYSNAIELAMQEMQTAFTDGLGFDYIQDEWDLTNQNAEQYLDTINSAYEIGKLENKFMEAINNTSSISTQKKLTAAMEEELKILEEAEQISQYDIDRAYLKYELTLKQIALEEAQANKNQVRLQRNAQGSYSYVFAADAEEIAKTQEELAKAENELYNFDKEAYGEKVAAVLKAEQDLQNKLQEIWNNTSLSEEQKLQYATMINEQYRGIIESGVIESEKMKSNLTNTTYTLLLKTFNAEVDQAIKTGMELDKAAELAIVNMNEKFKGLVDPADPNSTVSSIATTFTEWSKATGQIVQNAEKTADTLNVTFDNSFANISSSINRISGVWGDVENFSTPAGAMYSQASNLVVRLQDVFSTGLSSIVSKIAKGEMGNGTSLEEIFSNAMEACQTASNNFGMTINEVANAAGIDLGNMTASTTSLKDIMGLLIEKNSDYITKVMSEGGTLSTTAYLSNKYKEQYDKMKDLNSAMSTYTSYLSTVATKAAEATKHTMELTTALNKQYEAQKQNSSQHSGVGESQETNVSYENHDDGGGYNQPEPAQMPTHSLGDAYDFINSGAAGNGASREANMLAAGYTPDQIAQAQSMINEAYGNGMTEEEIKRKYNAYDTGGYTGDWHSSRGQLALLHEKELVLNKADTENILDIVSMVREMTSSSLRGADGLMAGAIERLASITNNSSNSRQEVYITAEFPNATSVAEIEEAFRSLPNIASQYAFSY